MNTTMSYELARIRIDDLHRQAARERLARAAAPSTAPRPNRIRVPVSLRLRLRRAYTATTHAAWSR
jgi:hypothetical protein